MATNSSTASTNDKQTPPPSKDMFSAGRAPTDDKRLGGQRRDWYLDVDYVEEVSLSEAFN